MLTFKPEMLEGVLAGRKTRTWRPLKERQAVEGDKVVVYTNYLPLRFRVLHGVGNTEAIVPKRGQKQVAKLVVTKITACTPNDATEADALAEGFESVAEFHAYLTEVVYPGGDQTVTLNAPGYAIEFHLACNWLADHEEES